ncbi:hypothetical protein [Lacibacter sp.]|uniref:hypothetical protein n=1 Tax=Lacibacter sp. TaxID=1915409 RepID=UPI002B4B7860|nr:hypothetical protein [Lacibacter sp.]HLP36240.1 hypothetical protein [Lacibacter sp.]
MQTFNETEWLRLLFLLNDTQQWLEEMQKTLLRSLPCKTPEKLFKKNCYLSVAAFAHILERHYHKIPRHPGTGKFTISIPEILQLIRQAAEQLPLPQNGTTNILYQYNTGIELGYDKSGQPSTCITLIVDEKGNSKTAFPGLLHT